VDGAAALELGHLGIADADHLAQLALVQVDQAAQGTLHSDGGPPPQLRGQGIPQHLGLRVVAARAERLPQPRVVLLVPMPAAGPGAVGAAGALPMRVTGQHQPALGLAGVDPAEAGGGEGHEQPRMLRDAVGDALAALEAGGQELVGVGPVDGRTGGAAGLAAGAARLQQHPIRLALGRVDLPDLARLAVGLVDPAGQADRVMAVAGLSDQLGPPVVAVAGPLHQLPEDAREQLAHASRLAHGGPPGRIAMVSARANPGSMPSCGSRC
jgi:hypothetical protein